MPALVICAAIGLTQTVKADSALDVAGIESVLRANSRTFDSQPTAQPGDEAVSALSNYARQIGGDSSKTGGIAAQSRLDDHAFSALRDFAQRVGAGQPESIKDQPKLAEATTLMELLQGKGNEPPATVAPKGAPMKAKGSSAPVDAHFVGGKVCMTCHASQTAEFQKTLMGKIGMAQKGKFECENCHGPGSAHVKAGGGRGVGGILSFGADDPRTVEERNGVCLGCHQKGERTYWAGSIHETRGVACTNCHTVMKNVSRKHQLKTAKVIDTCFQCHKLQRAQIQYSSHMPVNEGKLTCADCHNPHGSPTEKLLRAASTNELCYQCHAEKRGPMLFEHQPVRENCLNCHQPHGSNYENLLIVARPRLCHQCHTFAHGTGGFQAANPGTAYVKQNACGNCHSNIHGSNSPGGFFFLR